MVWSIVPEYGSVFPPPLVLTIQDLHQALEVDSHNLRVGVGLDEAEILLAMTIHGSDEGDPRSDHLERQGVVQAFQLPFPPTKV